MKRRTIYTDLLRHRPLSIPCSSTAPKWADAGHDLAPRFCFRVKATLV
jgi:hypothetical protein